MDKLAFGVRVHDARKSAGITAERLAELCNCTPVSIRQIESGARLPSLPKLVNICNELRVTPNTLLANEIDFPLCDLDVSSDRIERIALRLQRLPDDKFNLVCSLTESLLHQIEMF